jgi:hypothetical protein
VEGELNFSDVEVPDHLPRLDWGSHRRGGSKVCAMEAAAWLAGERWSDHPRSVHSVIMRVARTVNDGVSDDVRQTLWPLILASLDTARPRHPVLNMRLSRYAEKALAEAAPYEDLPKVWTAVLDEHARLYGERSSSVSASRLQSLARHLKAR